MNFDCIIIGGGLSGLVCGIKCAKEGLRTLIISGGMNSLHFSSGSVDVSGYGAKGEIITEPFDYIRRNSENKDHPYIKTGLSNLEESLSFFKNEMETQGLPLFANGKKNHIRATGLGIMKPTYFSQTGSFNERIRAAFESEKSIAVLNFEGFRDYHPELAVTNLRRNTLFENREIITGNISLPFYTGTVKNLHEFRSVDLARIFDTEKYLPRIADEIIKESGSAEIVSLPAFIGIRNFLDIHSRLEDLTGKIIYEVPTLPPSIIGMRLDTALKNRFTSLGGVISAGEKVSGALFSKNIIEEIQTGHESKGYRAPFFVLSSGSFFSGGLTSTSEKITEPLFNLDVSSKSKRSKWYSETFFSKKSQPFLAFGVKTDRNLNPDIKGIKIKNLFCTGAILSGYNPIQEGNGGGPWGP